MKKITTLISLCLVTIVLSSCGLISKAQNAKQHYVKTIDVSVDYGNITKDKATTVFSEEINLEGVKLFDKKTNSTFDKNFICGEKLEIYYKDKALTNIDYAVVSADGLACVKMTNAPVPGSDKWNVFEFEHEERDYSVNAYSIEYVINNDGSFALIADFEIYSKFYGIYRLQDIRTIEINGNSMKTVNLVACYSFNPTIMRQNLKVI